jgi:hypothetical protein
VRHSGPSPDAHESWAKEGADLLLDMFSRRKPVKFRKPKDDTERAIDDIEKFAPREYSKQREMCYYQYFTSQNLRNLLNL